MEKNTHMPARNQAALDFLLTRRSRPAKAMTGPAPDKDQLLEILTAAARTPDHGKLEPWRFAVLSKPKLTKLAALADTRSAALGYDAEKAAKGRRQFEDGQICVAVIEVQKPSDKIPAIEQTYSAGAACLALLNAGLAAGWGANWLTGWPSHDRTFVETGLGLHTNETLVGFVYFGTETSAPPERPRPNLDDIVTWL